MLPTQAGWDQTPGESQRANGRYWYHFNWAVGSVASTVAGIYNLETWSPASRTQDGDGWILHDLTRQRTIVDEGNQTLTDFGAGALNTLSFGYSRNWGDSRLNTVDRPSAAYGTGRFAGGAVLAAGVAAATVATGGAAGAGLLGGTALGGFAYGGSGGERFDYHGATAGAISGAMLASGVGLTFAGVGFAALAGSSTLVGAGMGGLVLQREGSLAKGC